jgi:hypothetical protein
VTASVSGLRIIVSGLIAQYPLGGVTWDYIQFIVGLQRLGHDVYYLEDTGQWPYNPSEGGVAKGCDFNVSHLADVMSRYGLEDRWMYRFSWQSQWFGLSASRREEVIGTADLVVNVSGTLEHPDRYADHARLVYIDSDPVFTQVKVARGQEDFRRLIDLHDVHFTFGELIERGVATGVPATGHDWLATRQPILLDEWAPTYARPREAFTTIMNWTSYKPVEHAGRSYGQKDAEFMSYVDLPASVDVQMEVAIAAGKLSSPPRELLRHRGWSVVDPDEVCPDMDSYRGYVRSSMGEWSVAKGGYVAGQSGWFSCRSACYLAAGRPVAVQDTGFAEVLPTGRGLFAFRTLDESVAAIQAVLSDYASHARAARDIAEAYFDSGPVLERLVEAAFTRDRQQVGTEP